MCDSIGPTEHTDRGFARVGLTSQDKKTQRYRGRNTSRQPVCVRVYVCVCMSPCSYLIFSDRTIDNAFLYPFYDKFKAVLEPLLHKVQSSTQYSYTHAA